MLTTPRGRRDQGLERLWSEDQFPAESFDLFISQPRKKNMKRKGGRSEMSKNLIKIKEKRKRRRD